MISSFGHEMVEDNVGCSHVTERECAPLQSIGFMTEVRVATDFFLRDVTMSRRVALFVGDTTDERRSNEIYIVGNTCSLCRSGIRR